jgi:predicted nuclease of predicted toxin-antitoxin system
MTRFLVDAQLPYRLVHALRQQGHDVVHTRELPNGNRTTDAEINLISLEQARVVITKDADFVESFLLQGAPHKLLLISTGNIDNDGLLHLILANVAEVASLFETYSYIELSRESVVAHQ